MHWLLLGTAALLLSGQVVAGAVAARTGWLPLPSLRSRNVRPRLWGYGTMLFGTGLLLMMSFGALHVLVGHPVLVDVGSGAAVLMIVAGACLQVLSSRRRLEA
ncbi:hypothetical protein PV396_40630 [Streptomyces sp. ME02-8801-2C]|uniref:hypothetical protein n=1 Tax=Streptomyces sp. ME02-8801-2C TaxID=3028680 RepID=UPI0029AA5BD3|nr:hypothetical protein [Streptomyces sp. ME02-8801-2C]MDX3458174.1 hypothetical protein [Streptomyces sp. ME02-8801-2C]